MQMIVTSKVNYMRLDRSRPGFTLIELLVVIAIIGVLVGMLMPAVQMVREAGRRTTCLNNLRQLSIAVTQYHDIRQRIPPSRPADGFLTWPVFIAPFMEAQPFYDRLDIRRPYPLQDPEAMKFGLPTMFCSSRRSPGYLSQYERNGVIIGSVGDYVGNGGTSRYLRNHEWAKFTQVVDGVFSAGFATENPVDGSGNLVHGERGRYKIADITDGLSNTIFLGEKAVGSGQMGLPEGNGDGCIYNGDEPATFTRLGGIGLPISAQKSPPFQPGDAPLFGSWHPGVSNFAFGDSSIRSLPVTIDEDVLRRFCDRRDGETVNWQE